MPSGYSKPSVTMTLNPLLSAAAGPAKPAGLVRAFTTLAFDPAAGGRRKWKAVFTFDELNGAANAQIAFTGGLPSITFAKVFPCCCDISLQRHAVQDCVCVFRLLLLLGKLMSVDCMVCTLANYGNFSHAMSGNYVVCRYSHCCNSVHRSLRTHSPAPPKRFRSPSSWRLAVPAQVTTASACTSFCD